jgi:hypothetical protein
MTLDNAKTFDNIILMFAINYHQATTEHERDQTDHYAQEIYLSEFLSLPERMKYAKMYKDLKEQIDVKKKAGVVKCYE